MFVPTNKPHWKTLQQEDEFDARTPRPFHYSALEKRLSAEFAAPEWGAAMTTFKLGLAESLFEINDDLSVYNAEGTFEFKNRPKRNLSGSLTLYEDSDSDAQHDQPLFASPEDSPLLTPVNAVLTASPVDEEAPELEIGQGVFTYSFAQAPALSEATVELSGDAQVSDLSDSAQSDVSDVVQVVQVVQQVQGTPADEYLQEHLLTEYNRDGNTEENHLNLELAQLILQALHQTSSVTQSIDWQSIWTAIQASQRSCRRRRCCCRGQTLDSLMKLQPMQNKYTKRIAKSSFKRPRAFVVASAA